MMLVLVVFFIFLAGALALLAATYSVQLARTTRQHHESIMLRQMAYGAYDWLAVQPDWHAAVPVMLDMKGSVPEGTSGSVYIRADESRSDVAVFAARLTTSHHEVLRTTSFELPESSALPAIAIPTGPGAPAGPPYSPGQR